MAIDVAIAAGLGRFFGAKFRSGVLFAIFEQSGDRTALELSLKTYQKARDFWIKLANIARDIYKHDITIGELDVIRGHWLDRLPAIDEDIDLMRKILEQTPSSKASQQDNVRLAIQEAMGRPKRDSAICHHNQPKHFKTGVPLVLKLSTEKVIGSVWLYYRHVNQAERFKTEEMQRMGKSFRATIPADYTNSLYPLQYYFELREKPESAWLYPGLSANLTQQPYYAVRKT